MNVLDLIRTKYNELCELVPGDTPDNETKMKIWCAACYTLIDDFRKRGCVDEQRKVTHQINVHYSIDELQPFYQPTVGEATFNKPSFTQTFGKGKTMNVREAEIIRKNYALDQVDVNTENIILTNGCDVIATFKKRFFDTQRYCIAER